MTDLLPCPFCGSTNLYYEHERPQGYICCSECGAEGPCNGGPDDETGRPAWNRRVALAEQPVGPTDEDLRGIFSRFCDSGDNGPPWIESEEFIQSARAVLARWGRPAAAPVPVSALVPALEEDCDAEGRCWWGATALLGSATGNIPHSWRLCRPVDRFGSELVWLPAHALPVPTVEDVM